MMKALLSICLLLAIFSPGLTRKCYQCQGEGCATPKIQKCQSDDEACVVAVTETSLGSSFMPKKLITFKQCVPVSACMRSYVTVSTVEGGTLRGDAQCCYTDLCNNMTFSLPKPKDQAPNGVVCPACLEIDSMVCEDVENLSCTGGETKCIEGALHLSKEVFGEETDVYYRGCATPNTCLLPYPDPSTYSKKMDFTITKLECTENNEDQRV